MKNIQCLKKCLNIAFTIAVRQHNFNISSDFFSGCCCTDSHRLHCTAVEFLWICQYVSEKVHSSCDGWRIAGWFTCRFHTYFNQIGYIKRRSVNSCLLSHINYLYCIQLCFTFDDDSFTIRTVSHESLLENRTASRRGSSHGKDHFVNLI